MRPERTLYRHRAYPIGEQRERAGIGTDSKRFDVCRVDFEVFGERAQQSGNRGEARSR
jgi:hypothetical protein